MSYEWEEEIPQPKPPTRSCHLVVEYTDSSPETVVSSRSATQADIARALGVTETDLRRWLDHGAHLRGDKPSFYIGEPGAPVVSAHPQWQLSMLKQRAENTLLDQLAEEVAK